MQPEREHLSSAASTIGAAHASDTGSLGALSYSDPLAILGAAPIPNEPWWQRFSPSTLFVLLACAIAIFFIGHELSISGMLGFPDDDAWTQQVFAKHFFHHVAFEFNVDERVASPESPFWVVVLAVGVGLFHDPILAAKLLGAIFLFLAGYYTYRALKSASVERLSALIGGALVITSSALAWSELSGLQSCLVSAVVMGALWWHTAMHRDGWSHAAITGAIFALAALTQPEAALAFVAVVLYSLFSGSHRFRNVLCMLGAFGLIIAPIAITNDVVGGTVLPPSVLATISDHTHGIVERLFNSFSSIGRAAYAIYWRDNPLWLFTIVWAVISRWRRSLINDDAIDHLFSICTVILVSFPYLFSLITGSSDFSGHEMAFVSAIYELAGVLSVAALVRRELFRSLTPKTAIVLASGLLLLASVQYLLRSDVAIFVVVVILVALFTLIALRHAELQLLKSSATHEVLETDRLKIEFKREEQSVALSDPALKVLRGVLMIAYAWNIAHLPLAARSFAEAVRNQNDAKIALARAIGNITMPEDAVAAYQIGAIGYFSERHVIDLGGELQTIRGTAAIREFRPKHVAIFSDDDTPIARHAAEQGLLLPEARIGPNERGAILYRITSTDSNRWSDQR